MAQAVGAALVQDPQEQSRGGQQDQHLVGPAPPDPAVASQPNTSLTARASAAEVAKATPNAS